MIIKKVYKNVLISENVRRELKKKKKKNQKILRNIDPKKINKNLRIKKKHVS